MFFNKLSDAKIEKLCQDVICQAETDREAAYALTAPLRKAQAKQLAAAYGLIHLVKEAGLHTDDNLEILTELYDVYHNDQNMIEQIAMVIEYAHHLGDLNAPAPEDDLFRNIIKDLQAIIKEHTGTEREFVAVEYLACTARLMARQYDDVARDSYEKLVIYHPDAYWAHYNQGLFFKTRGFFAEGVQANEKAREIGGDDHEAVNWNLGICATAAGQGEKALEIWQALGNKIKMGRFDLPEGGYPSCKVRLAEHPLAERDMDHDTAGLEETIWIERLSPCHGIIRSVLYQNLGVNYGDVIVFDGAPVTYHKYGDEDIPVFPHLATLRRQNYQFYPFAGTQEERGLLNDLSQSLPQDAVIYSHTENFQTLCKKCWNDTELDHADKQHDPTDMHVVTGYIAVPPELTAKEILNEIDRALDGQPENRIFSPELCIAAGMDDRARIEQKRYDFLAD